MRPTDALFTASAWFLTEGPSLETGKVALYGAVSAVLVALITVTGSVITKSREGAPTRAAKVAANHHRALENWINLNTQADPRKIKDGYETLDEVRRV